MEDVDQIKEKNISSVFIKFKGNFMINDFEGFDIVENTDSSIKLKIRRDINRLIKIIDKYDIENLSVTPLSLEDTFLEFYK